MEEPFSKYLTTQIEFLIESNQHFRVIITAHRMCDTKIEALIAFSKTWRWNVYAYIFPNHPLFEEKKSKIHDLHFSGGITLEEVRKIFVKGRAEPFIALKIGSDYQHVWDLDIQYTTPLKGIDFRVLADAKILADDLRSYIKE